MKGFFRDYKNRYFVRLWWAQIISQFGDRLNQMALIGLIASRAPGSTTSLAKLLSFTIIPVFIIGPIAGVLVDRWDRRRTLFVCDIIRALLVLGIPMVFMDWVSIIPIYIIVFLMFCFSRFHVPAKMSIIPDIVPQEHLLMANSLITTTGMIAFVLGCSLGGFLVDHFGAAVGFYGDAVTFLIAALLIMSIHKDFRLHINKNKIVDAGRDILSLEKSMFSEIKEGIVYLVKHKEIRFIINMLFILLASAGSVYVVIIVFIQQAFESITKDLGILAVFMGVGCFLGALAYGKWGRGLAWYKVIFFCLILGGSMIILFATSVHHNPNIIMASVLSLVLGFVIGPIFIASNTVIHLVSDENMRGKVFSALEIVIHFAFLAAMLVSSYVSELVDPVWILVAAGGICMLVGILGLIKYRKGRGLAFGG